MTIGERIRELREKRHLTQTELARAIGITKHTLCRYESGEVKNIPQARLEAIAAKLSVSPADLMGWSDAEHPGNMSTTDAMTGLAESAIHSLMENDEEDSIVYLYDLLHRKMMELVKKNAVLRHIEEKNCISLTVPEHYEETVEELLEEIVSSYADYGRPGNKTEFLIPISTYYDDFVSDWESLFEDE